ncbi:hypothetical protein ISS07_04680 [Candidatus Woesearchaeota archaeon]|nr:hypothetical protein [Candidatus Woesearchaeota archaeon]
MFKEAVLAAYLAINPITDSHNDTYPPSMFNNVGTSPSIARNSLDDLVNSQTPSGAIEASLDYKSTPSNFVPISKFLQSQNYHAIKNDPKKLLGFAYSIFEDIFPNGFFDPRLDGDGTVIYSATYDFDNDQIPDVIIDYSVMTLGGIIPYKEFTMVFSKTLRYIRSAYFDSQDDNDVNSIEGDDRMVVVEKEGPKFKKWVWSEKSKDLGI